MDFLGAEPPVNEPPASMEGCECLVAGPVGRRQGYTAIWELEIFWWQAQLEGDRATTAIWELEIFWWQAQLEGDTATTAIWEPEVFFGGRPSWKATGPQLQSGNSCFFGGRHSWKATGLQLQSGNARFFGGSPSWKATFFFLLYAAWVRSPAERPSVSYTKVVMEVAWTGHNLQFTKTN